MENKGFLKHQPFLHRIVFFLFMLAMTLTISGCTVFARIDGPYEGRVVDAETNLPIEGAVVHGVWYRVHATPAGSYSEYYDSYEILTDKNGNFKIPGQGILVFSNIDEMVINIFKAGFEQLSNNPWSGLKAYSSSEKVSWTENKATIKLRRLSLKERLDRVISMPGKEPSKKQKLLRIERNKEMVEIGMPKSTLLPME